MRMSDWSSDVCSSDLQDTETYPAALAALLHDVGLLLVPEAIRRTPVGRRTPAQQRRYQDHTVLGEALLPPLAHRQPALPLASSKSVVSGKCFSVRVHLVVPLFIKKLIPLYFFL